MVKSIDGLWLKGRADVVRAVRALRADLDGDVGVGPDRDTRRVRDALDGVEGRPDCGPGDIGAVRRVHVAVNDEPGVVGLHVAEDIEAADMAT